MEIAIAAFIGLWLSGFALWGYLRLKKEYRKEGLTGNDRSGKLHGDENAGSSEKENAG